MYGDDLPRIYALAAVRCFAPVGERASGLPALEGMASGVPVVASDRASLPEICADAALCADPDSPKEIAGQIDRLLDDKVSSGSNSANEGSGVHGSSPGGERQRT